MTYEVVMPYHLHMPSYFLGTFTEYPYISDTIAQEKIETFKTEQAFTEALCWRFGFAIRFVVAIVFVLRHIIVTQQYFLVFRSNGMVSP